MDPGVSPQANAFERSFLDLPENRVVTLEKDLGGWDHHNGIKIAFTEHKSYVHWPSTSGRAWCKGKDQRESTEGVELYLKAFECWDFGCEYAKVEGMMNLR